MTEKETSLMSGFGYMDVNKEENSTIDTNINK